MTQVDGVDDIERKVYVCPTHGEVVGVIGMGRGRAPLHDCGEAVEVIELVPASQLRGAVEDASQALMDALSHMDPDTARRFMDEASYKRFVRLHTRGR